MRGWIRRNIIQSQGINKEDNQYHRSKENLITKELRHVDGSNTFYDIGSLILWDINLGYDHGEMRLTSIEISGRMPWSEHKLVIVSLMFHDDLDASVGARVEDI